MQSAACGHRSLVTLALARRGGVPQGTKPGSPEENLPCEHQAVDAFRRTRVVVAGRERIAFMEKSFGDAYEVDVATGVIRLLTHYAHPGFLRVQFLPNGDYFLIGARTFTDISTTRSRDQEMWILKADFKPGDHAIPLEHKISEGVAISRTVEENRLVEHARTVSRSVPGRRVRHVHGRHHLRERPAEVTNEKEILRAKAPECTLEAQDFRKNDTELIYTCYRSPFADCSGHRSEHRKDDGVSEAAPASTTRSKASSPTDNTRWSNRAASRLEQNSNYIDIWKLKLEPNSQDFTRVTHWGEYRGFKASNPVVSSDGKRIAFQSARSKDPAGVGYGIFVMDVK